MKSVALRLAAEGGEAVEKDFDRVGRGAEAAMRRVEAATGPASKQLKLFSTSIAEMAAASNLSQKLDALFIGRTEARDRAADIAAYGAELDALREKYNPLFAVSRQYERELEEIARAEKLGAISAREAGEARERAAARMRPMTEATEQLTRGFAGLNSGMIQNASYQIGDFAVQVAGGVSPSTALAQQLPQLLGGFGAVGAVAGALVAIGAPLAAAFLSSGEGAGTLADHLDALDDAMSRAHDISEIMKLSQVELADKFAGTSEQVRTLVASMREAALSDLDARIAEAGTAGFARIQESIKSTRIALAQMGLEFTGADAIHQLALDLGLTEEKAEAAKVAMERFNAASSSADRNSAMLDTLQMLESWKAEMGELPPAAVALYEEVRKVAPEIAEAARQAANIGPAASTASDSVAALAAQATRAADELARAASNAMSLAAQGQSALRESAIRLKYKGDAVGEAGALAAERWKSQAGDYSGADPILRQELDKQRDAFIANAEATAQNQQALAAWNEEQRKAASAAAKSQRAGESEAKKEARKLEREAEARKKVIEGLEFERDQIGRTDLERKIAQETRRADVDLYSEQGRHIAELVGEMERLRAEGERVDAVNGFLSQSFTGLFEGAQHGIKGLLDAVSDLAARLADMAMSNAFESLLTGGGAGGGGLGASGFGMALSSLFGIGARARGGPVRSGQPYVVGEEQAELFVPDQSGYVYPSVPSARGSGQREVHATVGFSVDSTGVIQAHIQDIASRIVNTAMAGATASFRDGVSRAVYDPRLKGVR